MVSEEHAKNLNAEFSFTHNTKLGSFKYGENLYRLVQTRPFSQSKADCEEYAVEAIDRSFLV